MAERSDELAGELAVVEDQGRWRAVAQGQVIAETSEALTVIETGRPATRYFPRISVVGAALLPTEHQVKRHGPGKARLCALSLEGLRLEAAAWTFEAPPAPLERLAGHVAFDPDQVEILRTGQAEVGKGAPDDAHVDHTQRVDIAQPYRDTGSI